MCRRVWTSRETTPRHTNLLGFRRYSDASSVSPRGLMTGRTPYKETRVSPRHPTRDQAEHKHHPTCTSALSLYLMCPKVVSRPRPQLWHITVLYVRTTVRFCSARCDPRPCCVREPCMGPEFDGGPATGQNLTRAYLTEGPSRARNLTY